MECIYLPDSYNYNLIRGKFENEQEFIELQVKYRKGFEKLLHSCIDFDNLEKYVLSQEVDIPKVEDEEYNFYHKYSTLGSSYIYLRNNFHIESLSLEELETLSSNQDLKSDFYVRTLDKVMFEQGDKTFFGSPIDENLVNCNSLIFEFSYNQLKCDNLKQLNRIKVIIDNVFGFIRKSIKERLNLDVSFIVYNSIPDLFYKEDNEFKLN